LSPRARLPLLVLLVAGGLACGSTRAERDPWPSSTPPLHETVGWLDDRPVTYGDVARYLQTKAPDAFTRNLEGLVLERLTLAEAQPLAITVPRGLVIRSTEQRMREWEARVKEASREETGEEVDPALWLQRAAGVSVTQLRAWVEAHVEVELLQDRLLRYEMLTSPRLEVSMLLVGSEEEANRLAQEARDGADFAALAKAHSRHPSASEGGRVPFPLLPADLADPEVREALFRGAVGSIAGPFPVAGEKEGETLYQVYRIDGAGKARQGTYAQLEHDIARDLETRPVAMGEYERWRRRILLRHGFVAARPAGESDDSAS